MACSMATIPKSATSSARKRSKPLSKRSKGMKKFTDFLGDVMLMLCAIAGIGMMELVFVYLAMELSK